MPAIWRWRTLLAASFLAAYAPTFLALVRGPWRTEQESHGPLIIAAALWLAWRASPDARSRPLRPVPLDGWLALAFGLALLWLSRTQGLLGGEVLSAIIVLAGCVLLAGGRAVLRDFAAPIGLLLFAIPLPDWLVDSVTLPLKVLISDSVTLLLHAIGYPIAQDGVMIVIGPYEVLVQDACSGLNSIFALLAIGVFYVQIARRPTFWRNLALLLAIIPIAVLANFVRVLCLVLIAYYAGVQRLEGPLHLFTGLAMFAFALGALFAFDRLFIDINPGALRRAQP
jgi:exosortase